MRDNKILGLTPSSTAMSLCALIGIAYYFLGMKKKKKAETVEANNAPVVQQATLESMNLPTSFGSKQQQPSKSTKPKPKKKKKKKKRGPRKVYNNNYENQGWQDSKGHYMPSNDAVWDESTTFQGVVDERLAGMGAAELRDHHLREFLRVYPLLPADRQEKYHLPGPPDGFSPSLLPPTKPNDFSGNAPLPAHEKEVKLTEQPHKANPVATPPPPPPFNPNPLMDEALSAVTRTLNSLSVTSAKLTGGKILEPKYKPPGCKPTTVESLDATLTALETTLANADAYMKPRLGPPPFVPLPAKVYKSVDAGLECIENTSYTLECMTKALQKKGYKAARLKKASRKNKPPAQAGPNGVPTADAYERALTSLETSLGKLGALLNVPKEDPNEAKSAEVEDQAEGESKEEVVEVKKSVPKGPNPATLDAWASYHYTNYLKFCSQVIKLFFQRKKVVEVSVEKIFMEEFRGDNEAMKAWRAIEPPHKDIPEKYWYQRKRLFNRFDEGIKLSFERKDGTLDIEGWYSVTPELTANEIAVRCGTGTIVDPFVGVGGNAIAFAVNGAERVIAIDLDKDRLELARNNARVYGVEDKIEFIHGDAFVEMQKMIGQADDTWSIFLAPPWGGMYYTETNFDIRTMPVNGLDVFRLAQTVTPNIAYYVPRNVDRNQMTSLAGSDGRVEIALNKLYGKTKSITVYYGGLTENNL